MNLTPFPYFSFFPLNEDQTEKILSEANLTEEAFRTKIGEISSNPDQARQYRQAFERRLENR